MQQNDTGNFFRPISTAMKIPESDYVRTDVCVAMANALARNTNHSLYIIDYNRRNFLYVSSNPLFLCGRSPEEVRQKGYAFYFEVVPPDEMKRLMEINEAGFRFYYSQPTEKRLDLSIEYDFHLCMPENRRHLVHHKLTPVLLYENPIIEEHIGNIERTTLTLPLTQASNGTQESTQENGTTDTSNGECAQKRGVQKVPRKYPENTQKNYSDYPQEINGFS